MWITLVKQLVTKNYGMYYVNYKLSASLTIFLLQFIIDYHVHLECYYYAVLFDRSHIV